MKRKKVSFEASWSRRIKIAALYWFQNLPNLLCCNKKVETTKSKVPEVNILINLILF